MKRDLPLVAGSVPHDSEMQSPVERDPCDEERARETKRRNERMKVSVRQVHAAQNGLKPWVGAHGVKLRKGLDPPKLCTSLFASYG